MRAERQTRRLTCSDISAALPNCPDTSAKCLATEVSWSRSVRQPSVLLHRGICSSVGLRLSKAVGSHLRPFFSINVQVPCIVYFQAQSQARRAAVEGCKMKARIR